LLVADLDRSRVSSPLVRLLRQESLRSLLAVPLVSEDQLMGSLDLASRVVDAFDEEAVGVATEIGVSLALVMHNAGLLERARARRRRLQELSRRLVRIQEEERRAVARELHDEAGQALTALLIDLGMLEREVRPELADRVRRLKGVADGIMEGLHRLAVDLRPAALDRLGLVTALGQLAETTRGQTDARVELEAVRLEGRRFPGEVETTVYRVVQEALTNVVRHARARRVAIVVEPRGETLVAVVEDDGVGFDPEAAARSGRLGLFGMQERAEMLGGALAIESAPGAGTTVVLEVPAQPTPADLAPAHDE
jgi:signal transduction histidine kinase